MSKKLWSGYPRRTILLDNRFHLTEKNYVHWVGWFNGAMMVDTSVCEFWKTPSSQFSSFQHSESFFSHWVALQTCHTSTRSLVPLCSQFGLCGTMLYHVFVILILVWKFHCNVWAPFSVWWQRAGLYDEMIWCIVPEIKFMFLDLVTLRRMINCWKGLRLSFLTCSNYRTRISRVTLVMS